MAIVSSAVGIPRQEEDTESTRYRARPSLAHVRRSLCSAVPPPGDHEGESQKGYRVKYRRRDTQASAHSSKRSKGEDDVDSDGLPKRSARRSVVSNMPVMYEPSGGGSRRQSLETSGWASDVWAREEANQEGKIDLPLGKKIHSILDAQGLEEEVYASRHPRWTNSVVAFSFVMIIASVMILAVESLPQYYGQDDVVFFIIEAVCVAWFSVELVLRGATCPSFKNFMKSMMNWIDIFAVVPFYVNLMMGLTGAGDGGANELIILRVIRLTRVFRVFKLSKYNEGVQVVAISLRESTDAISLLMFLLVLTVVLFGSGVYFAEQGAATWDADNREWIRNEEYGGPNVTHHFESLPQGFWWCLVTVTTVGYGDKYPVTVFGYLIASGAMFAGLLIVAFPIIIIGAKFQEVRTAFIRRRYQREKAKQRASVILGQRREDQSEQGTEVAPTEPPQEVLEMKSDEDVLKELLLKMKLMQGKMDRMTNILGLRSDEVTLAKVKQTMASNMGTTSEPTSPAVHSNPDRHVTWSKFEGKFERERPEQTDSGGDESYDGPATPVTVTAPLPQSPLDGIASSHSDAPQQQPALSSAFPTFAQRSTRSNDNGS
eukprot:TRINITY_DN14928_c0_g1_i1.p1 TRINITY_DN14928_c0_g1~~TRINITY_DN14928_c0_g1_i1.p1  ORF type:complete len:601 (+),score=192.92 TRINITY_DN14928_c0_g1_i1:124-1926(+)